MALKEVCIAARTSDSGNTLEGDIIVIRNPLGYVGTKEQNDFIWMLVDDTDLPSSSLQLRGRPDLGEGFKHRFNIGLASITGLDVNRARDRNDKYQPFVTVRAQDGVITGSQTKRVSFIDKTPVEN